MRCILHFCQGCAWRCPFKESDVRIHTSIIDTKYHVWLLLHHRPGSKATAKTGLLGQPVRRILRHNRELQKTHTPCTHTHCSACHCASWVIAVVTKGRSIAFSHVSLISATSWLLPLTPLADSEDSTTYCAVYCSKYLNQQIWHKLPLVLEKFDIRKLVSKTLLWHTFDLFCLNPVKFLPPQRS